MIFAYMTYKQFEKFSIKKRKKYIISSGHVKVAHMVKLLGGIIQILNIPERFISYVAVLNLSCRYLQITHLCYWSLVVIPFVNLVPRIGSSVQLAGPRVNNLSFIVNLDQT